MKMIMAVIKPSKLDDVRGALSPLGVTGMTVSEVKGFGRQGGHTETYRGAEYEVNLVHKVRIETLVDDDEANSVIDAIETAARSGSIGDGKIVVLNIEDAIRIRTGERGRDAI